MKVRSRSGFGVADVVLASLIVVWGANYSVIKGSFRVFTPLAFNAARFALATLTVLALVKLSGESLRLPPADRKRAVIAGLLANTLYQLLFIEGLAHTSAGNAALIQATMPMQVAVLSHLLGRERLSARAWLGVGLATAGLFMLITLRQKIALGLAHLGGDALMLGAAFTWACYTLYADPLLARAPATRVTALGFLAGAPPLILVATPELVSQTWRGLPPTAWGALLFSGVLAIGLGYLGWNFALRRLGSTRTAVYSNLTPVVAAVTAWLTLGERWTPGQVAGAFLVLTGVIITRTAKK